MLYKQATFTLPSANQGTSQKRWDLAFLTKREFQKKYQVSDGLYERLTQGANRLKEGATR